MKRVFNICLLAMMAGLFSACVSIKKDPTPSCVFMELTHKDELWEASGIGQEMIFVDPKGNYECLYTVIFKESEHFVEDDDESHFEATSTDTSVATLELRQQDPFATIVALRAGPLEEGFKSGSSVITLKYKNGEDSALCNFKIIRK